MIRPTAMILDSMMMRMSQMPAAVSDREGPARAV
jgi:hypothetical protein